MSGERLTIEDTVDSNALTRAVVRWAIIVAFAMLCLALATAAFAPSVAARAYDFVLHTVSPEPAS